MAIAIKIIGKQNRSKPIIPRLISRKRFIMLTAFYPDYAYEYYCPHPGRITTYSFSIQTSVLSMFFKISKYNSIRFSSKHFY